jgi:hypothetical protein
MNTVHDENFSIGAHEHTYRQLHNFLKDFTNKVWKNNSISLQNFKRVKSIFNFEMVTYLKFFIF